MKKEFRVWCHRTKSWLHNEVTSTHVWSDYSIDIFNGKLYEYVTNDGEHFYKHKDDSEFTIHLWTGLYDKNGKKIFEGDIIHYKFNGDSYPKEAVDRILTCSYDEDEGMYSFDDSDHSYYWAEIKRHSNIIGNIYENPELLKA